MLWNGILDLRTQISGTMSWGNRPGVPPRIDCCPEGKSLKNESPQSSDGHMRLSFREAHKKGEGCAVIYYEVGTEEGREASPTHQLYKWDKATLPVPHASIYAGMSPAFILGYPVDCGKHSTCSDVGPKWASC